MKQNELFNKCCENIDPKTREEVWKQMDKELGREENRGNSPKIPSNSPKQTLEQAAGDYIVQLNGEDLEGGFNAAFNAFKAGAEWRLEQVKADLKLILENFQKRDWEEVKVSYVLEEIKPEAFRAIMGKIWDLMISLPDDNYFPELLKRFKEYKEQEKK